MKAEDVVICVDTKKIPADAKNYAEEAGLEVGQLYIVHAGSFFYNNKSRALQVEGKSYSHLTSNFRKIGTL